MAVEKVPFFHDPFLQQILEDDATLGQEPLRSKPMRRIAFSSKRLCQRSWM